MRPSYWHQLTKAAATIHGSGYDRAMSTFPEQRDMKPYQPPVDPGFTNKQTSQEAFKTAKPSVPYISVKQDENGNSYFDGAQTQKNIYGGDADFQRRAEAQMAYTRWNQSRSGGLTKAPNVPSLNHPVVLNPSGKDERGGLTMFKNYGPAASGNPNRNVPINVDGKRSGFNYRDDRIHMEKDLFPTNGQPFPETMRTLPDFQAKVHMPSVVQGRDQYEGVYNSFEPVNERYATENVLQEEATHAQSPTSFYRSIDKNNDPNVFAPKDRLPGEYYDEAVEKKRPNTPLVPGMQGSYDQLPAEFVKSRKLDQNDAQATYGHRIQNAKELLDYHNMLKVYGTDDEWEESQKNLSLQHAQALGRLRAMAIEQRKQEMEEARKSGVQPWISEDFIPLRPVQATYDFTDQTDLMKQVRNNRQPGRMDKIASTLNSSYNQLVNEARMMKIAATLRK
ncbi:hypothetical protein [uncultured Akkermansia sp.]|uniref:hypothetical protein n=1 Tax=uncultured Akkermansia sp. TaxID=512294 RepID=UPI00259194BF|nr:hypothetical protein [uncultured Akkermansia sp.]